MYVCGDCMKLEQKRQYTPGKGKNYLEVQQ